MYTNKKVCQRIPVNIGFAPEVLTMIDKNRGYRSRRVFIEELIAEKYGEK